VWTGSKMIVWGGATNPNSLINSGDVYELATDSWSPISDVDAPSARAEHTAVWTGSKMIVWGGATGISNNDDRTNTGGIYDPSDDMWSETSLVGVPAPRLYHTAVWTGQRMIIWGEVDSDVHIYDPDGDNWVSISGGNSPAVRSAHSAVWTGDTMIIWGGGSGNDRISTGAIFNLTTSTWDIISMINVPAPRSLHSGIWTGTELIIWGGVSGEVTEVPINTGGVYNPSNDSWRSISTDGRQFPRWWHSAVWTGTKMLVWGGMEFEFWAEETGNLGNNILINTGWIYDVAKDIQDYYLYIKQ